MLERNNELKMKQLWIVMEESNRDNDKYILYEYVY